MDLNDDSEDHHSSDGDDVLLLRKKLAETEDKLVKFKKFVVNLRNERTHLQEQTSVKDAEIEKLKSDLSKFQSKSYQQIFHNFQNLQTEFDKTQDEVELLKKTNKGLENDLLKSGIELSQCRQTCANQSETIDQLQSNSLQQQSQINNLHDANKELESRIIVLQAECKSAKKINTDFQVCESQRNEAKEELSQKNEIISQLSEQLDQSLKRINFLENDVALKDACLGEIEGLREENHQHSEDTLKLHETLKSKQEQIDKLNQTIDDLLCNKDQSEKIFADQQLKHSQRVATLELTISEMENKLKLTEGDLHLNRTKFDEYKQRVSSVLKENKLNNFEYSKNIEDLHFQIESLQEENKTLSNNCDMLKREVELIHKQKDEISRNWDSSLAELKEFAQFKASFSLLNSEKCKLLASIDQLKLSFAKEKQSILDENVANIEEIRAKYERKIKELEDDLIHNASDDINSVVNSNTSFEEIKEENLSFQSSNSNSERNFLEEILNFDSTSKSYDIPTSSNIDNLTQLLSESENSITLLSEQNRLLKEEIRRLQRSVDRMDIASNGFNIEYLKNVLLKFLTIKGVEERERLITVLTTILKLTAEERDVFHQCAQDNFSLQSNSKWSLWQWSS